MASAKEIQDRMRSIKDTLKITNAMYMISSSKLKKSKKMLADTEPYFYTLQSEMSRILRHLPDMNSIYFKFVRMALDILVVVTGVLFGGKFGVCTLITVIISGPIIQFVNAKAKQVLKI